MIKAQTLVRIPISEDILQELEKQAALAAINVEELIARRLPQITKVDSSKPIVLTDEDRRKIEKLIARNISTSNDVVKLVERCLVVNVDGVQIPLPQMLLERLKSRAIRVEWDKFLPMIIKRALEEYAGMR